MTSSQLPEMPPADRETLLQLAGSEGQRIYAMVRRIIDEAESAAPWALLYYPPEERDAFIEIGYVLVRIVTAIPPQVDQLVEELSSGPDAADEETIDSIQFFFNGIHSMASPELEKLRSRLERLEGPDGEALYTQQERDTICEISADLKGKYLSSIMGAAASLIAEGRWDGVEIEPILFPEKAQEFERNRHLVETLREVVESTRRLPEEVPLAQLVESWKKKQRVDQYALTSLYSFLGVLGKLMKESSRRALYSGDYHQIRKRERLVSQKINELSMLHNATWMDAEGASDEEDPYELMIQRACEIAALLNIEMLKDILGEPAVKTLRQVVVTASDRLLSTYEPRPGLLPDWWRALLPILQDDDLRTFFDLLLGSVLKRASLALDARRAARAEEREAQRAAAEAESAASSPEVEEPIPIVEAELHIEPAPVADPGPKAGEDLFIPIDFDAVEGLLDPMENAVRPPGESVPDPGPAAAASAAASEPAPADEPAFLDLDMPEVDLGYAPEGFAPAAEPPAAQAGQNRRSEAPTAEVRPAEIMAEAEQRERAEALGRAQMSLRELSASHNAQRRQFDFLYTLLNKKKFIPPSMVQSIYPFLEDVMETLVPKLERLSDLGGLEPETGDELAQVCRSLRSGTFSPQQLQEQVPNWMQRLVELLDLLEALIESGLEDQPSSPPSTASFFKSQAGSF